MKRVFDFHYPQVYIKFALNAQLFSRKVAQQQLIEYIYIYIQWNSIILSCTQMKQRYKKNLNYQSLQDTKILYIIHLLWITILHNLK